MYEIKLFCSYISVSLIYPNFFKINLLSAIECVASTLYDTDVHDGKQLHFSVAFISIPIVTSLMKSLAASKQFMLPAPQTGVPLNPCRHIMLK